MRTDDPLDLSEYYAQRGRILQELGALRDFARLRNRREWQWRRLWLHIGDYAQNIGDYARIGDYVRIKHLTGMTPELKLKGVSIKVCFYDFAAYLRERRYAWQR